MKLEYLKKQLETVGSSGIGLVLLCELGEVQRDQVKAYPYVFWDILTLKSRMAWQNSSQQIEEVTIKAYIMGSYDRNLQGQTQTMVQKWDTLREFFRAYMVVLNASTYIKVSNLNNMTNELFNYGLSPDGEIGVSFDVNLTLYCNTSV
jgi:hypothetical protein